MMRRAVRGQSELRRSSAEARGLTPAGESYFRFRLGNSKGIEPARLRSLFRAAGWTEDIARYSAPQIRKLLRQSHTVLTAWDGKNLVGLASAVSDGVLSGMVQNLVVHPRYRRRGLGARLLRELARVMSAQRIGSIYVLGTPGGRARAFFNRAGFRPLRWGVYVRLNR
ncbi:MAG: GNAT family N-acetyltransferase [Candidatus Acidiferrales bacterium]